MTASQGPPAQGTSARDRGPSPPASTVPVATVSTTVALTHTLAAVGAVGALALILFYALELSHPAPYVFGTISDITGAAWNVLLLPLVIGFGTTSLPARGGRPIRAVTVAATAAGAVASTLLVAGALSFEVSTSITVVAALIQAAWLFTISRGLRSSPALSRLSRLGQLIGVAIFGGALLIAVSLLFGWAPTVQLVLMAPGLAGGVLAWISWPVWVFLLARALAEPTPSLPVRSMS